MLKQRIEIDSRMIQIIDVLGGQSDYYTLSQLAKTLGLSRRQIEHDIIRINALFESIGLSPIETKQNNGVKIAKENLLWFSRIFQTDPKNVRFIYQKKERVALIIIHIIIGGSLYTYEDLCSHLGVSRTTIFSDMQDVQTIILETGASIHYDFYYKYYIKATGKQYTQLLETSAKALFSSIPKSLFEHLISREIFEELNRLYDSFE